MFTKVLDAWVSYFTVASFPIKRKIAQKFTNIIYVMSDNVELDPSNVRLITNFTIIMEI